MDVRVKFNPLGTSPAKSEEVLSEILTGIPKASVVNLLDILSNRHPELAPVLNQAKMTRERGVGFTIAKDAKPAKGKPKELKVFVNNDPVPRSDLERYQLRDGDTVSLFLKQP